MAPSAPISPNHLSSADLSLVLSSERQIIVPAAKYISDLIRNVASRDEALRVQLGLQEAIQNAFEHGNGGGGKDMRLKRPKKTIRIKAALRRGVFSCTIQDQGKGFGWRGALARAKHPAGADKIRGRGLFLLSKIFDRVRYNPKGNIVVLTKKIGRAAPPKKSGPTDRSGGKGGRSQRRS